MKLTNLLLFFLIAGSNASGQVYLKHNLFEQNLKRKVKTVKETYGPASADYILDSFDKNGNLAIHIFSDKADGYCIRCIHDPGNKIRISVINYDREKTSDSFAYIYNDYGQLTDLWNYNNYLNGSYSRHAYQYDRKGNRSKETIYKYSAKDTSAQTIFYKYNSDRQLTELYTDQSVPEDSPGKGPDFFENNNFYREPWQAPFTGRVKIKYHRDNSVIEQDVFGYTDNYRGKVIYTYDSHASIVRFEEWDQSNLILTSTDSFTYDKNNNWIKCVSKRDVDKRIETTTREISYY